MSIGSIPLTADELLRLPERKNYELANGELVELGMSAESSWIAGEIHYRLRRSLERDPLGLAFPEGTGYQCFAVDPERVRKPDASFVRRERLPSVLGAGWIRVAPDLAVEVVSPHDLAWQLNEKVEDWLEAGVPAVWVVTPQNRTVIVHSREQGARTLHASAELTLEGLIPAFRCRAADFFPPVQPGATQPAGPA